MRKKTKAEGKDIILSARVFSFLCILAAQIIFCVIIFLFMSTHITTEVLSSLGILMIVLLALVSVFFWNLVIRPYRQTEKLLKHFGIGYSIEDIYQLGYSYSPAMGAALEHAQSLLDTDKILNASKQQAQFLALQNQINPHFLYNTLEGIRGEALASGLDTVANMAEALSTYFRYTISNVENLATLEDELNNIENYFTIQRYRFGPRMNLEICWDEDDRAELLKYRLPKLTLQPIVENAIVHGLECKVGKGTVHIRIEVTQSRLLITISDDGVGMNSLRLEELNTSLTSRSFDYIKPEKSHRSGIAIVNVNNRLKLLFGEEYGISVSSTADVGTDVVISLPKLQENDGGVL
ncbi:sensor histidine kinase [Parasphaerochaeta coccoides]|uniref:Integral membrane sensor signal transduction histidine kinase n=1 Tax=Parasphaerochaeta coccoides (strain ATCC BAA-1237 / DSM 17374 / SPN1) TaxID=760011 RepID=F4GJS7_PARC1|nr:sensor histidine kinase [Parasphaerochaeta coccoides]AEC02824.1 integral membrane sensor signal transduction histidine kinase [Parasphaerochaeta coccoides DSM 17374]